MISIVIPNYNSANLLEKNLPTLIKLLDQSKFEYEIIVSDDASTDDSILIIEKLKNSFQISNFKFQIIQNPVNVGFGANVDRGIRASVGEIVFVLNAIDLLPEKSDYFKLMLDHFKNKDVFSVAANKKDATGNHGQGIIIFFRGFYLHFHSPQDYENWLQTMRTTRGKKISNFKFQISNSTDWADGGAQAIRKEYYLKIGGFDPKYFLYWEDVDLGFRAWKAGYKIVFEPKAVLIHQKNEGPIAKRFSQNEIRELNIKNQIYFTWKNSDLKHKLLFLLWLPYHLAISLKNHDWIFFKAVILAASRIFFFIDSGSRPE